MVPAWDSQWTPAPPEPQALVIELRAALAAAGLPFDPKPFASHVTRVREARPPERMPALDTIA